MTHDQPTPREQSYLKLVEAMKQFLYSCQSGEDWEPELRDLQFAARLHVVLEDVPIEYEGLGEP